MKFSQLFKTYRQNAHLSKSDIARLTDKTIGYIQKIEDHDYTPPTFDFCNHLSEIFKLTSDDKTTFLQTAFQERIKNDIKFFNYIYTKKNQTLLPDQYTETEPESVSIQCIYQISWFTHLKKPMITKNIKQLLEATIQNRIKEFNFYLHHIQIDTIKVTLLLEIPPESNILEVINGLKSLTSGLVHHQFPDAAISDQFWQPDYTIHTVSTKTLSSASTTIEIN